MTSNKQQGVEAIPLLKKILLETFRRVLWEIKALEFSVGYSHHKNMSKRRKTPLHQTNIEGHHCTVDLRLEKLGMVPFFQDLSEEELQQVHKKFNATHFEEGETIYYQSETATLLRVVVEGKIKLIHQTLKGKDILLEMLKSGEFFGSLSALGDEVYNETAQAQTNSCVLAIGLKDFREILSEFPAVALSVLDITAKRLASSNDKIRQLTTLSVEKRLANILIALSDKFGEKSEKGLLIQLPLSRKDLADMSGTSEETASRIMSGFQQEGIIKTGRKWVAILDREELESLLED